MAWPINVADGDYITSSHINSIKNAIAAWGGNVNAGNYALNNLASITVTSLTVTNTISGTIDWSNINNKPLTFAPSTHIHSIADITNLQMALDAKEGSITAGTLGQYYRGDKTWQTLNAAAISGLAASATTDTTNASNISSGALALARISQGGATTNQVLQWNGTTWTPATVAGGSGGTGDVVGPASSTNTAIAVFDGTSGKLLKNSNCTIAPSGNVNVANSITVSSNVHLVNQGGDANNGLRLVGSVDNLYIVAESFAGSNAGAGIVFRSSPAAGGSVDQARLAPSGNFIIGTMTDDNTHRLQVAGRTKSTTYAETRTAPAIAAGVLTVNLNNGNVFDVVLNANITTLSITNPPASGTSFSFVLQLTADGTARSVTWGSSVKWPSGTAPTLTSTNGKVDTFIFITDDGGTNWYAFVAGQNA